MAQEPARTRAHGLIPGHVLAHVPGFNAGGTAWATRLPGGTVNQSYRVETSAGRFVVRLQDEAARALGANPEREIQLHAAAAGAGLAPALIHADAARGFMIMEHLAGPVWTAADFERADRLGQLGAALHALHAVAPPPVAAFDLRSSLERHCERLSAALPDERLQFEELMQRAVVALEVSGTVDRASTLVHNDLCHANLIGSERLFLIDWEYAAVTDPLLDLACVLAYYPRAAAHAEVLLDSSRLAAVASPRMLEATTWLSVLLSYFWYRARRLAGTVPAGEIHAERALFERLDGAGPGPAD